MTHSPFKYCYLLGALIMLGGCQTDSPIDDLLEGRQIDYTQEENQTQKQLQYPPDLFATAYATEGTVSLSEYTISSVPTVGEQQEVADDTPAAKVTYRRNGNLRWIEIELPPNNVWEIARGFWTQHLGFGLVRENAELGTMETDWLDLRERVATPGWFNVYLDDVLNRLNDSGERDKFTTRLEKNENGGTDVYVAHRHIVARFDGEGLFSGYESQSSDRQLEIEMLRRVMLYLANNRQIKEENSEIEQQIAATENNNVSDYEFDGGTELVVKKPFHESWQLVQVGLNRGGFSIEDRDYQEGIIYIRHSGGPDSDKIFGKAETNFFNKLFGEQKPILRDIKLIFSPRGEDAIVLSTKAVEGDDALTKEQSSVVLELLNEFLP